METYIVHPNKSQAGEEVLPPHVIEGIRRGQADVDAERTITFEAFKEKIANKR